MLNERVEIVRAIKYVDEVIVTKTLNKKEVWEKVRFNEIYIGDDWKGNARWEETGKEMESLGAKLVFPAIYERYIFNLTSREVKRVLRGV